jgi:hypothetical protein
MAFASPRVLYDPQKSLPKCSFAQLCKQWGIKHSEQTMEFHEKLSLRVAHNILSSYWNKKADAAGVDKYIFWIWTVAPDFTRLHDAEHAKLNAADNVDDYYLLSVMRKSCGGGDNSMASLASDCFIDFSIYQEAAQKYTLQRLQKA